MNNTGYAKLVKRVVCNVCDGVSASTHRDLVGCRYDARIAVLLTNSFAQQPVCLPLLCLLHLERSRAYAEKARVICQAAESAELQCNCIPNSLENGGMAVELNILAQGSPSECQKKTWHVQANVLFCPQNGPASHHLFLMVTGSPPPTVNYID